MGNWLSPGTSIVMHAIGWALMYSLWQGLLVCGTLFVFLRALKNASARTKYNVSCILFTGLFIWFVDTWITEWQRLQTINVFVTASTANSDVTTTSSFTTLSQAASQTGFLHSLLPKMERQMPLIVGLYFIGLMFMLLRFLLGLYGVRMLRRKGVGQPAIELEALFTKWQRQLNISRQVQFLISTRISVPMMMGVLKPVILLPLATISQLSIDELEAILLHELAHIKRNDYLLNVFQTIIETVLFFNPFVWLISSVIRREREHCCDDLVVANTGSALPYAKALATLGSYRLYKGDMALAVTGKKDHLFNRIKRIMEMKKRTTNYSQLTVALILVLTLMASLTWLAPGFAQKAKTSQGNAADTTATKKKIVKKEKIIIIDEDGNKKEYTSLDQLPKEERQKLIKELNKDEATGNKKVKKEVIVKTEKGANDDDDDIKVVMSKALNEVDWDKIGKEVNDAMKEVGAAMNETKDALKNVDWTEVSKDLQEKLVEIKKQLPDSAAKKEMTIKIKKQLKDAGEAIDEITEKTEHSNSSSYAYANTGDDNNNKISVSAPAYDKMLEKMEADGLIDRVNGYKLEKKGNRLFINDIEQTNAVFHKYERYLGKGNVTIKGDKDHIKINVKE